MIFMPESPWWLVRMGRLDQARVSIKKLGRKGMTNVDDVLAMMVRTVEIETKATKEPTYLDLFKGIDLRRTMIIGCVYAGQNLGGNLIANQAVFFFERELK
jgi:SP family general alpha glucoside:H+ symporter-like MFS transporter